jgi:hypothetical protein
MTIHVTWSGGDTYSATVTPSHYSTQSWTSDGPMLGAELITQLVALGCHQQDIVDAFVFADPDFVVMLNRGDFN